MPVDRSFLSGWVDDDGSGLTGTIWNKARISQMLDGIDAGSYVGAWTTYAPTFKTAGDPQPSIGNGSLQGIYMRTNKRIDLLIYLSVGSTSYMGTGAAWMFGLPPGLPVSGAFPFNGRGTAIIEQGTFTLLLPVFGYITTTDFSLAIQGSGHAGQNVPVTVNAGARFHIGAYYITP